VLLLLDRVLDVDELGSRSSVRATCRRAVCDQYRPLLGKLIEDPELAPLSRVVRREPRCSVPCPDVDKAPRLAAAAAKTVMSFPLAAWAQQFNAVPKMPS